jgi:hypothetical protein
LLLYRGEGHAFVLESLVDVFEEWEGVMIVFEL